MPRLCQGLEEGLSCRSVFDPLVRFARLAASCELREHEERYAPFIVGCGYEGLSMAQVRAAIRSAEGGRCSSDACGCVCQRG